ncbi:chromosome segregation protein [Cytobacillus eiseniae]|uniref:Nuclease SbcCD subunit C n=1 Tax=Cytobacillus eiseniae TaxID=762947 RepID=A0ABS4RJM6_9BACI|nr:AAA family ATPase [Cytobacillus eiseniae]MBP2243110.1 chromosome segregation protein [Cytobacillus eiseniae]
MIPWRLRFSGIRDYIPTVMDLSEEHDHILISGPNGAGKSTVTFCMGGVLYSSKVDVDGLKSNNLPADQTWRAKIDLLFKNAGEIKVDAPQYVQFRLEIEQKPGDPIKREFYIEEGDEIDKWERTTKFTSGGNLNFAEYKNQVLYKYAVDPDAFYLIWYQKEVNQFAIMHPEERFRIFSEMNGIDKIQKNWEESIELVKETEQSLKEAEGKQGLNKMNLKQKKKELDHYHDRNRRREEGFTQYYRGLKWLETHYLNQIDSLKLQIEELLTDKDEKIDTKRVKEFHFLEKKDELEQFRLLLKQLEGREDELGLEVEGINNQLKVTNEKIDEISEQIAEITKQVDRIGMSESDVQVRLNEAEKKYNEIDASIKAMESKVNSLSNRRNDLIDEKSILTVEIKQDKDQEKDFKELMVTYLSSNAVQEEMDKNNLEIEHNKDRLRDLSENERKIDRELTLLKNNKVYNPRQEQSIRFFKRNQIEVYPLRELVELDETASQHDEYIFNTIKYTLFVNKKAFEAPNDLYHVSLPNLIPDKTIMHLPDKHLKVKDRLDERLYPYAIKALWWVESFFKEEKPLIVNGQLIDEKGIRGPQEDKRIILSEKVLQFQQAKMEEELTRTKEEKLQIEKDILGRNNRNSTLFRRRELLKEAEAFFTKENEREWRQSQFDKVCKEIETIEKELRLIQDELNEQRTLFAQWRQSLSNYREYLEIYQQFRKEQAKIAEVQRLNSLLKELKQHKKEKNKQFGEISNTLDKKRHDDKQLSRKLEDLESDLSYQDREIEQMERQIKARLEERVSNEEGYFRTRKGIKKLQESVKDLVAKFNEEEGHVAELTKPQAEDLCNNGKSVFEFAVSQKDIDEAAPENYAKMKDEYDRSENEVKKSRILLEEYSERMERSKEDLEDTINMKIIGVNQKFVNYMSLFGFEGKIEWDMNTDRRGQIRYTLFIKARKEGHRGKLEDVSVKARGGKVGKGVSGGEESLSSLLFALALLQTIEASPGYIVLDEFDSALDEGRKDKVFELYEQELQRKMIILTPKSHEEEYLYRFSKAYVVHHNPNIPRSTVFKVKRVRDKGNDLSYI